MMNRRDELDILIPAYKQKIKDTATKFGVQVTQVVVPSTKGNVKQPTLNEYTSTIQDMVDNLADLQSEYDGLGSKDIIKEA